MTHEEQVLNGDFDEAIREKLLQANDEQDGPEWFCLAGVHTSCKWQWACLSGPCPNV